MSIIQLIEIVFMDFLLCPYFLQFFFHLFLHSLFFFHLLNKMNKKKPLHLASLNAIIKIEQQKRSRLRMGIRFYFNGSTQMPAESETKNCELFHRLYFRAKISRAVLFIAISIININGCCIFHLLSHPSRLHGSECARLVIVS